MLNVSKKFYFSITMPFDRNAFKIQFEIWRTGLNGLVETFQIAKEEDKFSTFNPTDVPSISVRFSGNQKRTPEERKVLDSKYLTQRRRKSMESESLFLELVSTEISISFFI